LQGAPPARSGCEELGHQVVWASPRFDFEAALRVLTNFFAFGLAGLAGDGAALGVAAKPALLHLLTNM
jgi:hypothetical protein